MPNTINFNNLSGGLNLTSTQTEMGGSMDKVYWNDIPQSQCQSFNVRPMNNTGIIPMNGNTLLGTSFNTYIQGLQGFKVNLNEYLIVVAGGNLYQFNGLTYDLIQNGLNSSEKVTFALFGQGMIVSDGITEPFIYFPERIEQNLGTIQTTSTSKIIVGAGFEENLNAGDQININGQIYIVDSITNDTHLVLRVPAVATYNGNNTKLTKISYLNCNNIPIGNTTQTVRSKVIWSWLHRIFIGTDKGYYWSALGSYSYWTSIDNAGFSFDIGKPIVAIRDFRNQLVFYHGVLNGTTLLNGTTDPASWVVSLNYSDRATSSQWGILTNQMQQYFMDQAVFSLAPNQLGVILLSDELSKQINNRTLGILNGTYDPTRADQVIIVNNIQKRELWFYLPILGESEFNTVYIFDYVNQCWFRRKIPQNVTCATTFNSTIYVGTDLGNILSEDSGGDFNGIPISWQWSTQFFNFASNREKEIDEFNLVIDDTINYNANFGICTNYNPYSIYDTYQLSDSINNTLIWDTSTDTNPQIYNCWSGDGALVADDTLSLLNTNTGYADYNPNTTVESFGYWATQQDCEKTEQLAGCNQSFSLVFNGTGTQKIAILGFEMRSVFVDP